MSSTPTPRRYRSVSVTTPTMRPALAARCSRRRLARERTLQRRHVRGVGVVRGHALEVGPHVDPEQLERLARRTELDEELVRENPALARLGDATRVRAREDLERLLGVRDRAAHDADVALVLVAVRGQLVAADAPRAGHPRDRVLVHEQLRALCRDIGVREKNLPMPAASTQTIRGTTARSAARRRPSARRPCWLRSPSDRAKRRCPAANPRSRCALLRIASPGELGDAANGERDGKIDRHEWLLCRYRRGRRQTHRGGIVA